MPLPQKIIEGLITKADKIRALDAAGFSRAEIASFLGVPYQHVRNTLVQGRANARLGPSKAAPQPTATSDPWPMERLIKAGFHLLADCSISSENAFGYSAQASTKPGVYAFAVDGVVAYIGLTRGALRTRLSHYVRGHEGQKTSAHIKERIIQTLRSGAVVQVLVVTPPELEWNGLPVDGAAGLETGLIRLIKPAWNRQGHR
jgi:hypothetical protein